MIKSKNTNRQLITIAFAIIAIAILIGALCTTTSYETVSAEQSAGAVVENLDAPVQATPNELYATTIVLFDLSNCKITAGGKTYNCSVSITYLATEQLFILLKDLGNAEETISNRLALSDEVENGVVVKLYSDTGEYYDYYMKRNGDTSLVCKIKLSNFEREFINGLKGTSAYADIQITNNNNNPAVIYNCDGGYFEETPEQNISIGRPYVKGEQFQIAGTPIKPGYKFRGWLKGNTLHTPNSLATFYTDGDINFKAFWDIITYEITYKVIFKNGKVSDFTDYNNTAIENYTVLDNVTLTNHFYPAEGCNLYRWYYASDLVNENGSWKLKEGAVAKTGWNAGEQAGNIKVYAVEIPIYYLITYDWNGGRTDNWQVGSFPTKFSPVVEIDIKSSPFRTGYDFIGWKVDGTDTIINEGKQKLNYTHDITLIAQWRALEYTITYKTYNTADNSKLVEITKKYTIENTPLTLHENPDIQGFTLVSWIPSECVTISDNGITFDKTKATSVLEAGTYGDRTFYSFYEPIYYLITYDWNGGRTENWQVGSFPTKFSPAVEIDIKSSPFRTGYDFIGWKVDGTSTIITEGEQLLNYFNDITLIAQWGTMEYSILYKFIGNDNKLWGLNFTHKYTIEDNVVLENYYNNPNAGYKISKWHRLSDFDIDTADNFTQTDKYYLKDNATTISGWSAGEKYGDITIYAAEVVNWWDIKYYWNGSEVDFRTPPTMYRYTYNYFIPTFDLPKTSDIKPIKIGSSDNYYIIEGWYSNPNFTGEQVTQITEKSSGNKTFYLKTRTTAKINYKIIYLDEDSSREEDSAPDTHKSFMQNIGDNFKIDYICTYAYKLDWFIPVLSFIGNLSYTTEYVFVGWSKTKYTYKDWKNATESTYRYSLVNDNDFEITSDVDLYGCFVKTNSNFKFKWMWDTKFKVYTDNKYLDARLEETGQTEGKYIVTYGWLIDKANADNETVLWKEQFYQKDGEKLILPNTEELLADINNYVSVDGIIFGVNYKFLGWTKVKTGQAPPDLNVWKSLRTKEDIDKYELLTNESDITVDGNYYLFAIFVGESVYRSIFGGEPTPDDDIPINTPDGEGTPNWLSALMAFFGINKNSGAYSFFEKMSNGGFTFAELWEYDWFKVIIIVIGIILIGALLGIIIKISTAIKTAKTARTVNKLSRQIKQKELEELKKKNE